MRFLPPHPCPLPWGEGVGQNTIGMFRFSMFLSSVCFARPVEAHHVQTHWLDQNAPSVFFPPRGGEGRGEGTRRVNLPGRRYLGRLLSSTLASYRFLQSHHSHLLQTQPQAAHDLLRQCRTFVDKSRVNL